MEAVAGDTAGGQGRHEGGGTGQATHLHAGLPAGAYEQETRIADSGGTRIGNQGVSGTCLKFLSKLVDHRMLIVGVVGPQGRFDAVMLQQGTGRAGVFGQDQINITQEAQGPLGDVFSVTDGGGDEVEQRTYCLQDVLLIEGMADTAAHHLDGSAVGHVTTELTDLSAYGFFERPRGKAEGG